MTGSGDQPKFRPNTTGMLELQASAVIRQGVMSERHYQSPTGVSRAIYRMPYLGLNVGKADNRDVINGCLRAEGVVRPTPLDVRSAEILRDAQARLVNAPRPTLLPAYGPVHEPKWKPTGTIARDRSPPPSSDTPAEGL